jgi:UDP-2,3-diacylglucosamine pyrophosphatase LpxH
VLKAPGKYSNNLVVRKIKLVVSDFHLGKGRHFADGTQNILEDFVYDREFAEFLNYYSTGPFAQAEVEIILNGDILNLLQIDTFGIHTHLITERSVVRAIHKIISGHREFFDALAGFAAIAGHTVSYVVGNHDVGMLWPEPRRVFSDAIGAPVSFYDVSYQFDGIHVEHGQQHEPFAKVDMLKPFISRGLPEPVLNLPWGSLFVAVLLPKIKQARPHVDKVRPTSVFFRWVMIHDFVWGVKACFWIMKFIFDTVLLRSRYQIHQGVRATLAVLKEITIYPNYDKIAFKVLESEPSIHTVIFGHTHLLRYRQWREGKLYLNIGTWNEFTNLELDDYGKHIRLTYACIEYPLSEKTDQKPWVRLKQWNGSWKPEIQVLI